jgi:uncharacterized membrane protein
MMESKEEYSKSDSNEEKVDNLLLEQIKENYTRYVDNVWRTIQFLVIAIGWLLTSSNAKETIASSFVVQFFGFVVILALFSGHVFVEIRFFRESQRILARLKKRLECFTTSDIRYWQISFNLVSANTTLVFVLFLFVFVLVLKSPDLVP